METLHYNNINLQLTRALDGKPQFKLQRPELLYNTSQLQCHPPNSSLSKIAALEQENNWLKDHL